MQLRSKIIESAQFAVHIGPTMSKTFFELTKRMVPNKAIIRIARKLLNRILKEFQFIHYSFLPLNVSTV